MQPESSSLSVSFTSLIDGAGAKVGVLMVVSTLEAGAVFRLQMDPVFAAEVLRDFAYTAAMPR